MSDLNDLQKKVYGYVRYRVAGRNHASHVDCFAVAAYTNQKEFICMAKNNFRTRSEAESWIRKQIKSYKPLKSEYQPIDVKNYLRSII